MRVVKYFGYVNRDRDPGRTGCVPVVREVIGEAFFHHFVVTQGFEDCGPKVKAVLENMDGEVFIVDACEIQFKERPITDDGFSRPEE